MILIVILQLFSIICFKWNFVFEIIIRSNFYYELTSSNKVEGIFFLLNAEHSTFLCNIKKSVVFLGLYIYIWFLQEDLILVRQIKRSNFYYELTPYENNKIEGIFSFKCYARFYCIYKNATKLNCLQIWNILTLSKTTYHSL